MKICLYFGGEKTIIGKYTGIGTAFEQQKKALRLAGVDFTTNPKDDFDLLHTNWFSLQTRRLVARVKDRGKKVIIHAHTTPEEFRTNVVGALLYGPAREYLVSFYNLADIVLVPSEYTKHRLVRDGVEKPMIAVSNGIDTEALFFDQTKRDALHRKYQFKSPVVFNVAHVIERKGIADFVETARKFPETSFVWFGKMTSPLSYPFWKNVFLSEAEGQVVFPGFILDKNAVMNAGDIFFFPSYEENQGIALLEGAYMGKAIVVRDIPVYAGWLQDGVHCLKAKDAAGFTAAINRLLDDEALRKKLGQNARQMAMEHSLTAVGLKLKKIYESVLLPIKAGG